MQVTVFRSLFALGVMALAQLAHAQMTPVGTWNSLDDETKEVKSRIVITDASNGLVGKIDALLRKNSDPNMVCDKCEGDRKGKPLVGLEIIRGGTKEADKDVWQGGQIIDPENGKEYRASFTPIDGGKKLEVRGFWGPFSRTQTWVRVP